MRHMHVKEPACVRVCVRACVRACEGAREQACMRSTFMCRRGGGDVRTRERHLWASAESWEQYGYRNELKGNTCNQPSASWLMLREGCALKSLPIMAFFTMDWHAGTLQGQEAHDRGRKEMSVHQYGIRRTLEAGQTRCVEKKHTFARKETHFCKTRRECVPVEGRSHAFAAHGKGSTGMDQVLPVDGISAVIKLVKRHRRKTRHHQHHTRGRPAGAAFPCQQGNQFHVRRRQPEGRQTQFSVCHYLCKSRLQCSTSGGLARHVKTGAIIAYVPSFA